MKNKLTPPPPAKLVTMLAMFWVLSFYSSSKAQLSLVNYDFCIIEWLFIYNGHLVLSTSWPLQGDLNLLNYMS